MHCTKDQIKQIELGFLHYELTCYFELSFQFLSLVWCFFTQVVCVYIDSPLSMETYNTSASYLPKQFIDSCSSYTTNHTHDDQHTWFS